MLAEELMRYATHLQPALNMESEPLERERFIGSCESVRVLCRIAALHRNADYQQAAVIAPATDYAVDAEHLLRRLAASQHEQDAAAAAEFGIALSDWLPFAEVGTPGSGVILDRDQDHHGHARSWREAPEAARADSTVCRRSRQTPYVIASIRESLREGGTIRGIHARRRVESPGDASNPRSVTSVRCRETRWFGT